MRRAPLIELNCSEREELVRLSRKPSAPSRAVLRAEIILRAADGWSNIGIAQRLGICPNTVGRWRQRYFQLRLRGILKDAPRGGRKPLRTATLMPLIIARTTREQPPPTGSVVLCADEKSQIQALDRTQKGLPLYPGRCGTFTHDYNRHGTTTLFAAFDTKSGAVYGMCQPRHRHQEWLRFLKYLDRSIGPAREVHMIVDNYFTHKHDKVNQWLKRHPRFRIHFIPTSSSWLNLIERWFRDLTQRRIRRGSFRSVTALVSEISDYIDRYNIAAKPYLWQASVESILSKISRAKAVLDKLQSA